jgi:hypothetical protein
MTTVGKDFSNRLSRRFSDTVHGFAKPATSGPPWLHEGQSKSSGNYRSGRIAGRARDPLDVALLVNGLAVFISAQIDP